MLNHMCTLAQFWFPPPLTSQVLYDIMWILKTSGVYRTLKNTQLEMYQDYVHAGRRMFQHSWTVSGNCDQCKSCHLIRLKSHDSYQRSYNSELTRFTCVRLHKIAPSWCLTLPLLAVASVVGRSATAPHAVRFLSLRSRVPYDVSLSFHW